MLKAVIQFNFSEPQRQLRGLSDVSQLIDEGDQHYQIEVICHGDGIDMLVQEQTQFRNEIDRLHDQGVRFIACQATMQQKGIALQNLLPGVSPVASGAAEIIHKQQLGFGYFRP